jgi:hypothetical protein
VLARIFFIKAEFKSSKRSRIDGKRGGSDGAPFRTRSDATARNNFLPDAEA